ncbi:MAG TPA: hypothetical protein VGX50_17080 [Longimicrobium sp.]|nr:hypothetical protein [Longimicrobium sp.]
MVVLAVSGKGPRPELVVAPITHGVPADAAQAVELPANVKRDLGLDRERSWILATELNRFAWPGPDLRPLADGTPFYGAVPDWLFRQVQGRIGAFAKVGRIRITRRTQ